jgi:predicted transglutaminase-like cysteine proteinase
MRYLAKIAAAVSVLGAFSVGAAQAAFIGMPMNLKAQLEHIKFETPTLAPMAHMRFCMNYLQDCRTHKIMFRSGRVKLTAKRMLDLVAVNAQVNAAIRPEPNLAGLAEEKWLVSPASGDCNDYAVTKRHDLIARGWPADSLLLAEVVTRGWLGFNLEQQD